MRVITVLGPSQSGKTTLVRQLAHVDGHPHRTEVAGEVAVTQFAFLGEPWAAIDLAGGPEFARMAAGPLAASDLAVLCVAPDPDEAVLAAPYLRAIEASGVPAVVFVNKLDNPKGRIRDVVAALQAFSGLTLVLRQIPIREGGKVVGAVDLISERAWRYREGQASVLVELPPSEAAREQEARAELLEHMSEYDDALLAELIEDHVPAAGALFSIAQRETAETRLIPVFLGAAEHHNGVTRLMKALRHETPGVAALAARLEDATAVAFHAETRKHLGKCVHLRALGAPVVAGVVLGGATVGGLAEIGGKAGLVGIEPGEIAVAIKSDHLNAGQGLTAGAARALPDWARGPEPTLARLVTPVHDKDDARLSAALARLAETDPALRLGQDAGSGHAVVTVQGPMHLRQVLGRLAGEFGLEVRTAPPLPRYLETVSARVEEVCRHRKQSGGAGQFADVTIVLAPRGRGEGFAFDEAVKGGVVPRNFIPAVEEGAREALVRGPLGFAVTDVAVTLVDGKHHAVDSNDHAFRTAGRLAVKEALAKAGPVLLQPVARVTVHVPSVHAGAIVTMMSALGGQVLGFDRDPAFRGWDEFRALLPEAAQEDLATALASATQGCGWFEAAFDHYEEVFGRDAERVLASVKAAQG